MKKSLYTLAALVISIGMATSVALGAGGGTITQLSEFISTSSPLTAITQRIYGKKIYITGLSDGCLSLSSKVLTSSGSACGSGGGGGSSYPFTSGTTFGTVAQSTTSPLWLKGSPYSLFASSTSVFDNASSTLQTVSGTFWLPLLTSGELAVDANGKVYKGATTTAGTGLTYSGNALNVNTTQNIAKLSNLTGNGFVKTGSGDGTLSIDTNTYLTGNQTITLSGDVSGSGATSIATTLATVNGNVGSFGGSTSIPNFTVNGKGLITAAGTNAVIAPAGTLTGTTLASNVVNSSLTSLGTLSTLTVSGQSNLGQASTTLFSSLGPAYFGSTATSSFSTAGALTLSTPLTVGSGGSGANSLTGILLGNGTSAFTGLTTSAGISGAISDETGSGALTFATTPTFTTSITTPMVIGGTGTNSTLTLESTSGAGATDAIIGKVASQAEAFRIVPGIYTGFGTSTPHYLLELATSTAPQLALTDGSLTSNHWTLTTIGGTLYVATSSPSTYATSSGTALTINPNGRVGLSTTSPQAALEIGGTSGIDGIRYPDYSLQTSNGYLLVQDQETSGTAGGTSIAGTQARVLNTVIANTIVGASLSSNQVTLPAGTYRIHATAPTFQLNKNKLFWFNVTDTATTTAGLNAYGEAGLTDDSMVLAELDGRFTITATKTFSLKHYTQIAKATQGLGVAVIQGVEIYAQVEITRE